jgi:hypothetical protein
MNTKYILILFVIIFVFLFVDLFQKHCIFVNQENFEDSNQAPVSKKHILITRYKETDISIVLEPFINKKDTTIFIYNKGDDIPLGIPHNITNLEIIQLPNLGWDAYGFLYHVIHNYDNLPDYIYTFHASIQYLEHKHNIFKDILDEKHNDKYYYGGNVGGTEMTFSLDDWASSTEINKLTPSKNKKYSISSIRPLNKWLLSKINKIPDYGIAGEYLRWNAHGMFFVHKSRILKYPISFYINLFDEISVWQSEVNHYLERSWFILYGE